MSVRTIHFRDLDANAGSYLGASGWMEVGQDQTDRFASLTGDDEWIHVDIDRATRHLGGTIVHGYHLLSLIPLMAQQIFRVEGAKHGLNYGIDRLRFVQPVRHGDPVRLHQTLSSVTPRAGGSLLTIETNIEMKDNSRPALVTDCLFLFVPDDMATPSVD